MGGNVSNVCVDESLDIDMHPLSRELPSEREDIGKTARDEEEATKEKRGRREDVTCKMGRRGRWQG